MEEALAALRGLHVATCLLPLGCLIFATAVTGTPARPALLGCFDRAMVMGGALAGAATGVAVTLLQASLIRADEFVAVITGTQFGQVMSLRLLLLLALAAAGRRLGEDGPPRRRWISVALVLAAAQLVALSFAGHAGAGEGSQLWTQLVASSLHLVATAAWIGSLPSLLHRLNRSSGASGSGVLAGLVARYSMLGVVSVSLLLASGLLNADAFIGGFSGLLGTSYGHALLAKIALVVPLLAVAAYNLRRLRPALRGEAAEPARRALARNVKIELALGTCVLGLVGWLGTLPPARHVAPSWPLNFRFSLDATQGQPRDPLWWGIAAGVLGVVLLAAMATRYAPRRRALLLVPGAIGVIAGAALCASAVSVDAYPTTFVRPAVAYTAISVGRGQALYLRNCLQCHGAGGFGDGPVLKGRPANKRTDLTAKHTGDHTAGDLFWWIGSGIPGTLMPAFSQALSTEDRWDLINFLRAVSAAEQGRGFSPISEPAWLVAPDFAFTTSEEEPRNLKELRGNVVHLVLATPGISDARLRELAQWRRDRWPEQTRTLVVAPAPLPADLQGLWVAIEGGAEVHAAFSVFSRSPERPGDLTEPPPAHLEFLIDRQGYVRARWSPDEDSAWRGPGELQAEIQRLLAEPPAAPAPDDHVH